MTLAGMGRHSKPIMPRNLHTASCNQAGSLRDDQLHDVRLFSAHLREAIFLLLDQERLPSVYYYLRDRVSDMRHGSDVHRTDRRPQYCWPRQCWHQRRVHHVSFFLDLSAALLPGPSIHNTI